MNRGLDCFALTVVIIGAINWGLIGFFQLGSGSVVLRKLKLAFQNHLCTGRFMRICICSRSTVICPVSRHIYRLAISSCVVVY